MENDRECDAVYVSYRPWDKFSSSMDCLIAILASSFLSLIAGALALLWGGGWVASFLNID